jgi:hypothetical protein
MTIPRDVVERAWSIYLGFMSRADPTAGTDPNQKMYWLGGFSAALGVLVGTLDVGISPGTLTKEVIDYLIMKDIPEHREEIARLEIAAKARRERIGE